MKDLQDKELVIFDLETTGLNPREGDKICEIAAVKYKGREKIASFYSLVNPQRPVSSAAYAVNRIDEAMLRHAPKNAQVLPRFLDFLAGTCLAAYNIRFDLDFLQRELKDLGKVICDDIIFFDILALARRTLPGLSRYSLANVARSLDVKNEQQHRAMADVEMTWEVLECLFDILGEKGIRLFSEVYTLCGFNANLLSKDNEQKVAFILRAIDFHFDLSVRYFSRTYAEVTERKVSPKEVYEEKGRKYLLGFCHLRKDERNFAIESILHLDVED